MSKFLAMAVPPLGDPVQNNIFNSETAYTVHLYTFYEIKGDVVERAEQEGYDAVSLCGGVPVGDRLTNEVEARIFATRYKCMPGNRLVVVKEALRLQSESTYVWSDE